MRDIIKVKSGCKITSEDRNQQSSMQGFGIETGTGVGKAIGVAPGNIAAGIAAGAGVGIAIGAAFEKNRNKDSQVSLGPG